MPSAWFEDLKHPLEGVLTGDAIGEFEEGFEPIVFQDAKRVNPGEGIGLADHGEYRDTDDIPELMSNTVCRSRIGQVTEKCWCSPSGSTLSMTQRINLTLRLPCHAHESADLRGTTQRCKMRVWQLIECADQIASFALCSACISSSQLTSPAKSSAQTACSMLTATT